jgi:hypothetical protein
MNKKNQKGYAILFTVVLVSVISLIAVGLSNTIYKQMLISSTAKDSQIAFFQSDMAVECAMYAETNNKLDDGEVFDCGIDKNDAPYLLSVTKTGDIFTLLPPQQVQNSSDPCFRITIEQTNNGNGIDTEVLASGYNTCNQSGLRAVERTIQIIY